MDCLSSNFKVDGLVNNEADACYNVAIKMKADCLVDSGRWTSFTDGQIKADSLKALNCWQMTCLYNDRWQK